MFIELLLRIHSIVSDLGLSAKLDFVICSEDAKTSKPEPGIFLATLQRAQNQGKSVLIKRFTRMIFTVGTLQIFDIVSLFTG